MYIFMSYFNVIILKYFIILLLNLCPGPTRAKGLKSGGGCEPISAPLFMRGETTHHSFFTTFSDDKNRTLCGFSAEKRRINRRKMNGDFNRSNALF